MSWSKIMIVEIVTFFYFPNKNDFWSASIPYQYFIFMYRPTDQQTKTRCKPGQKGYILTVFYTNIMLNTGILCNAFYALLYYMHSFLGIVFNGSLFMHCILCAVFFALFPMHCFLCIVFYALYSIHYILFLCIVL